MPEGRVRASADELREVLAEEASAAGGAHPSDDDLLALSDGAADEAAEARLRDHLVACRECSERLLDLTALRPGEPADDDLDSEIEHAAAWRDLRASLGAKPAGGARALRSLAAVLALAVVGLGVWVAQLRHEVDRLAAPQANLPILYLDEPVRAAGGDGPAVAAPGADGRVLLIVTPPDDGGPGEYRAVVAADGGPEVWSGSGLRPSDAGTLRLLLPRRRLAPGRYELRLSRRSGGASRQLGRYPFAVLPEARGPDP